MLISVQALAFEAGFGFGFFQMSYLSAGNLNSLLRDHGYPEIESKFRLDFGGGGYFVKDRILVGLEGGSLSSGVTKSGGRETRLEGGFLTADLGYMLWKKEVNMVYANVGLGYAGLTLSVKEQEGVFDTYKLRDISGGIGKVGVGYMRRFGGFIMGVEIGAIHPLFGLEAEGRRMGTVFITRLLVGGGIF